MNKYIALSVGLVVGITLGTYLFTNPQVFNVAYSTLAALGGSIIVHKSLNYLFSPKDKVNKYGEVII